MHTTRRGTLIAAAALFATTCLPAVHAQDKEKGKGKGKARHHHKNGKDLLGEKLKSNGRHTLEKNGPHAVSVDVKDGKVAGMHVKHDKKGELPVRKYKTNKKMAQAAPAGGIVRVGYMQVQQTYLGTTWIGYSYYDDWGDEQIYWFPYDVVLDGDTGAVEYIPAA
jgi:hypothetical protein